MVNAIKYVPIPTMTRKTRNTGSTGGQSFRGNWSSPTTLVSKWLFRRKPYPPGMARSPRTMPAFSSGQPRTVRSPRPLWKCPSMADILAGW